MGHLGYELPEVPLDHFGNWSHWYSSDAPGPAFHSL